MTEETVRTVKLGALLLMIWAFTLACLSRNALTVAGQEPNATRTEEKLVWLNNYQAALKEAQATGKPIFLEFRCAP
ncbi:MAG TPA: hypothetical protein VJ302_06260 [Blastocatellia bacterium]|nr:hypothetical protein [Blastocatellia bacterium]